VRQLRLQGKAPAFDPQYRKLTRTRMDYGDAWQCTAFVACYFTNPSCVRRFHDAIHDFRRNEIDDADRIEIVVPEGFDVSQCRPVWRIEKAKPSALRTTFIRRPLANAVG
jgi:hypothetical protein